MPISTRQEFIDYTLRTLGAPVVQINVDPQQVEDRLDESLKFMEENKKWFTDVEIEKFKRVTNYMKENPVSEDKILRGRRDFYSFFTENDKRLGTDLLKTFPEYTNFYNLCKEVYENYNKNDQ